jgi:RNA polymerase sigma-70 factor, ECF subfamily
MQNSPDVTQLLIDWSGGDRNALEQLMPLVYRELQLIAHRRLRRESANHTLQTTALIQNRAR